MEKLTAKQKLFCETYVSNNFNGAQAAIAVGYSKNSSRSMGSQLLTKLNVQNYIEKLKEKNDYDDIVYLTPDGEILNQKISNNLS